MASSWRQAGSTRRQDDLRASHGVNEPFGVDSFQKQVTKKRQIVVQGNNPMRYFEHLLEGFVAGKAENCFFNRKISFLFDITVVELNSWQRVRPRRILK